MFESFYNWWYGGSSATPAPPSVTEKCELCNRDMNVHEEPLRCFIKCTSRKCSRMSRVCDNCSDDAPLHCSACRMRRLRMLELADLVAMDDDD